MGNKWTPISIIILSASILLSSFYLGDILKTEKQIDYDSTRVNNISNINDDMLTTTEAASFLNISEARLQDLIKTAELYSGDIAIPYYSINNEVRFSKESLTAWLVSISKFRLKI
ncbi:helix-turn-helix domain-containing protein [Desulfosporosinus shakirovi]|uniref:helix-turn-helix domain-containing protein n=1 Tax=Desulfosporosinus shakirovi TaxID=2885154 RepID=UPI001E2DE7BF|nr:helix-turn-helix domain-containing protein [Desulfosporosinus sp. SRJS8]MCB8815905.1 helix-turn-helix domain-containing protein [Desulfosporosinus sp. SRJS8]